MAEMRRAAFDCLGGFEVKKAAEILNGLCGVIPVHGNNLETTGKSLKQPQNASPATTRNLKENIVWESKFDRQVSLKGTQYNETSSPEVQPEGMDFTAGPAASPSRRHRKSRSLFVATHPAFSPTRKRNKELLVIPVSVTPPAPKNGYFSRNAVAEAIDI